MRINPSSINVVSYPGSDPSMESKLGKFEPAILTRDPVMTYRCTPVFGGDKGKALYVTYQDEMTKITAERKELLRTQRESASNVIGEIKARYTRRRQEVNVDSILTRAQEICTGNLHRVLRFYGLPLTKNHPLPPPYFSVKNI